ncbi:hypothetical protein Goklo_021747, partial [Gossypium klotzschianum]|nr:hypothetical protein [Gossypium klotzschianum]
DGDEATYHEIIFKELKCLGLYDLQNLKSFSSGNYTLKFPALDDLTVINCPAMENFCNGALSTPKLQQVLTGWEVRRRTWDLNATIEQLKQRRYRKYKCKSHIVIYDSLLLQNDRCLKRRTKMVDIRKIMFLE